MVGNNVSHSNRKTKRRFFPNLVTKRFFIPEDESYITLKISTSALRTINKKGISACLKEARLKGYLKQCCLKSQGKQQQMAKKTKGNRIQVILECTEHKETGMAGTSRYITTKNRKNTPDRMEIKKFNPVLKKYTLHKEIK